MKLKTDNFRRKKVYKDEWWFVVVDVIEVLTDTPNPKDYLNKMRRRDEQLDKGYEQIVHPLFLSENREIYTLVKRNS